MKDRTNHNSQNPSESERQLRLITDNAQALIAWMNPEQRYASVNKRYADSFGLTPDDLVGQSVKHILGEKGYAIIKNYLKAALSGEPQSFEAEIVRKSGAVVRLDVNAVPDMDHEGRVKGVCVLAIDITEQFSAQKDLKNQRDLLSAIINSTQDPIFARDRDGRQLMMNTAGAALFGLLPEDTIGKTTSELFSPEVAKEFIADDQSIMSTGQPSSYETELRIGDTLRYYQTIKTPIRNALGQIEGIVGIARDITNIRGIEHELRKTTEYLDSVLSNISAGLAIMEGPDFRFIRINQVLADIIGASIENHIGKTASEMLQDAGELIVPRIREALNSEEATPYHEFSAVLPGASGQERWYMDSFFPIHSKDGKPKSVGVIVLDTTDRKLVEQSLAAANEQIETERRALEEKNVALRELIYQTSEERYQLSNQIKSNVERIILPILAKLEGKSNPAVQQYIELLRSSLREISSSFVGDISAEIPALSPREIEIVNMVREGKSSKEIASVLDTAEATVRKQRKTIRKKLGIANKSINLRSYLQSSQFRMPASGSKQKP